MLKFALSSVPATRPPSQLLAVLNVPPPEFVQSRGEAWSGEEAVKTRAAAARPAERGRDDVFIVLVDVAGAWIAGSAATEVAQARAEYSSVCRRLLHGMR